MVHFGGEYEVLMGNCAWWDHDNTQISICNDEEWHVNVEKHNHEWVTWVQPMTKTSAWFFDLANSHVSHIVWHHFVAMSHTNDLRVDSIAQWYWYTWSYLAGSFSPVSSCGLEKTGRYYPSRFLLLFPFNRRSSSGYLTCTGYLHAIQLLRNVLKWRRLLRFQLCTICFIKRVNKLMYATTACM